MLNQQELLRQAYIYASEHSTDPSTQNAALLVNDSGKILASAANCFPNKVIETPERWERPLKYKFVEHAERNVIYKAARQGITTEGLFMVCPWAACSDCARAIIQAGIDQVITHTSMMNGNTPEMWQREIEIAKEMFAEAGVNFIISEAVLGTVPTIRFNGQRFQP